MHEGFRHLIVLTPSCSARVLLSAADRNRRLGVQCTQCMQHMRLHAPRSMSRACMHACMQLMHGMHIEPLQLTPHADCCCRAPVMAAMAITTRMLPLRVNHYCMDVLHHGDMSRGACEVPRGPWVVACMHACMHYKPCEPSMHSLI